MKIEPNIDMVEVGMLVEQEYGIAIQDLIFIPTEWLGYNYVVECTNGDRYFLKLHDTSGQQVFAASSVDFYLPLTRQLHYQNILPHIPYPILTLDGKLQLHYNSYVLILQNYIEGKVIGHDGLTGDVLSRLAYLLGKLHRSISEISVSHSLIEKFDIVFEDELMKSFSVLSSISSSDNKGKRHLKDLLLFRKEEILDLMGYLKALQKTITALPLTMAVCHTDLHGENLMLDGNNNLYIIDWENALIAPPEHDLFFFAGYDSFWNVFLPNYKRAFGPVHLNADVFGFYYYRRGLEDLADWIIRILRGDGGEAQDQADLDEIEGCLTGLAYVEKTITGIREHLNEIAPNAQ